MAYAAVFSLSSLSFRKLTQSERDELESLRCTLIRLDDWCYRGIDRSEINELEVKITEAVWKLEDALESYQLSLGVDEEGVEQEIHSFFNTTRRLREEYKRVLVLEMSRVAVAEEDDSIGDVAANLNSTTVGLSDLSQQIIAGLLQKKVNVFSIWGMAGIGKTHIARDIYHHPLVVESFDLRLWVRIGPNDKDMRSIIVDILAQIESKPRHLFKEKDRHELRDLLWESLLDRTYLIVFDDIWSVSVLSDCIYALPFYLHTGSILVTTRLYDVATRREGSESWQIPFLSDEESWNLLCQNVFGERPFPTQLEKAGRKIAQICEGLPLLILVVANILRSLDETEECWSKVAEKKTTTFPDAYDRIYKVLVSSYDYLLQIYKACFLYMGVFCQSHLITVSKLIHLWSVEDFHGDNRTLNVFVSSSLAIACKHSSNSRIKSCKLHSTYWYVCVTEARKNKLFHVLNKLSDVFIERRPRRLSVQNNMLFGLNEVYDSMAAVTSLTRSLLFTGGDHQYPVRICFDTMLLMKVMDALAIRFYEFPNQVLNLLQLKYLALTHYGEVPSSISKLQCLRFLILRRYHNIKLVERQSTTTYLPNEIWDLQELWYLRIMGSELPDPSVGKKLPKLSRLYVNTNSCTKGVLRGTPALKKLGIEIELQPEGGLENSLRCLEHTQVLHKLESLKCVVVNPRMSSQVVAPPNHLSNLPTSLVKLSLKGLGYPWKYMNTIGSLSNLQVLKLRCSAFRGPEWKVKYGEFRRLRYLVIEDMDVELWTVEECVISLRCLVVRHCYKFNMISASYLKNMTRMEVDECSPSVVELAQQINDSQPYCQVVINYSWNL